MRFRLRNGRVIQWNCASSPRSAALLHLRLFNEDPIMTDIALRLKDELLRLSETDRAALAHILLDSLDEATDDEDAAAWEAELNRRSEEIHSGKAVGTPASEVFEKLRKRYS